MNSSRNALPSCGSGLHGPSANEFRSLVSQLQYRRECYELMRLEERRIASKFDIVLHARPDLIWPTAVPPFCFWDMARPTAKRDWALLMTRKQVTESVQSQAEWHEWHQTSSHTRSQQAIPAAQTQRSSRISLQQSHAVK